MLGKDSLLKTNTQKNNNKKQTHKRFSSQTYYFRGSFSFLGCQIMRAWGKEWQKAKLKKRWPFGGRNVQIVVSRTRMEVIQRMSYPPSATSSSSDWSVLGNLQTYGPDPPEHRAANLDNQVGRGPEERSSPWPRFNWIEQWGIFLSKSITKSTILIADA